MENKKNFIINVAYVALIICLVYLAYKYLLPIFAPFIIGFVIAYIALKVCQKLFKNESRLFKTISIILVYVVIIVILVFTSIFLWDEMIDFMSSIPSLYKTYIEPAITVVEKSLDDLNKNLPSNVQSVLSESIDGLFDTLKNLVVSFSTTVVSILTGIISYTPTLLVNITVVIVASCFILFDYDKVKNFIKKNMSPRLNSAYEKVRDFIENVVFKILKNFLIIMFITFVELLIGFGIIGIKNYALIALLVSFVDIFPILGVGTVLNPWAIIAFIMGDFKLGFEMLGLYIIITLIRNFIEPKLVGKELGLHPLISLIAMIVGMKLAGVFGMLTMPLVISFLAVEQNIIKYNN